METDFLFVLKAAHPLADGDTSRAHQYRDGLLAPALRAQLDHFQAAGLEVGGDGVVDQVAELGVAPEEVPLQESLDRLIMQPFVSVR